MDLNSWASLPIRFNSQNSNNKDESTAQTARSMFPNKFKEWDEVISRFIWSGKKTLQLPQNKGEMALPHLGEYFYAAQLRSLACWCRPDDDDESWGKEMLAEVQGYKAQILVADKHLTGSLKCNMDQIVMFILWKHGMLY